MGVYTINDDTLKVRIFSTEDELLFFQHTADFKDKKMALREINQKEKQLRERNIEYYFLIDYQRKIIVEKNEKQKASSLLS